MDLHDPSRFVQRKPPTTFTDHLLGVSSHAPFLFKSGFSGGINCSDELSEEDIVFAGGDYTEYNHAPSSLSSSTSSSPRHHLHNSHNYHSYESFRPPDVSGILTVLPENEASVNGRINGAHFVHKSSLSSASSSSSYSSCMIPVIPKPPQDRIPLHSLTCTSIKYHYQSAPVNIPIVPLEMKKTKRRHCKFDEVCDEDDEDDEMLPPHEIVARNCAQTRSVLEGAGRTLKGRDLRKVRNAVWLQTGFID